MNNEQIVEIRNFFKTLANFPFLLSGNGVNDYNSALNFINSFQEEEILFECFLSGLISQSEFYPINIEKWLKYAKYCNFNHLAIIDENMDLEQGGPVVDWYIYPKFIKWICKYSPKDVASFMDERDHDFLHLNIEDRV